MAHLFHLATCTAAYDDIVSVERPPLDISIPTFPFRVVLKGGHTISSQNYHRSHFQKHFEQFLADWEKHKAEAKTAREPTLPLLRVKKLSPQAQLPKRATSLASCFDVFAPEAGAIAPGQHSVIKLGIAVAVPAGYEIQVRSRSGHAAKSTVFVLNSPGTVDADYRGEVGAILMNLGSREFKYSAGDRVAQIAVTAVSLCEAIEVEVLDETSRGAGGFGSTG